MTERNPSNPIINDLVSIKREKEGEKHPARCYKGTHKTKLYGKSGNNRTKTCAMQITKKKNGIQILIADKRELNFLCG